MVVVSWPRILQPDALDAVRREGAEHEGQSLAEAAHDDRVSGVGATGTHPPVVAGEHGAQVVVALGGAVTEVGCRQRVQGVAQRPEPVAGGKGTQVGDAVAEVDARDRVRGRLVGRSGGDRVGGAAESVGDPGARPDGRDDVPLGEQLFVRRDHQAPGDAQLVRELPCRGQPLAGAQPTGPDRGPQRLLDLLAQRDVGGPVHRQGERPARPRRSRRSSAEPSR